MRWTIASKEHAKNGLQAIEEIPDHKLCLIEGQNGVGKSVAIQLLELIAGHVPSALTAAPTWRSFRGNLGNTAVEIENMAGGSSARVVFTPDNWPIDPPEVTSDQFGVVTLDGNPATMSELAALIEVTTVRGDESLQDTVRSHIQRIESDLVQTTGIVRTRANELDEFVARFSSDWKRSDPAAVAERATEIKGLEEELARVKNLLTDAEQTAADLERAMEIGRKMSSADADIKALLDRRASVKEEVDKFNAVIQNLEDDAKAAEEVLAAQGGSAAELSAAEKKLRGRETRLGNQQRDQARWAASLALPPDKPVVAAELKSATTEQRRLAEEIDKIDRSRRTQDVLRRIVPVLDGTAASDSDEIFMVIDENRFSGRQVRTGFAARSDEIAASPRPEKALETLTQMDKIKRRIGGLNALRSSMKLAERAAELVDEAKDELKVAQAKSEEATAAAATVREISEQIAATQSLLTAAHQEAVELQEQIGLNGVSSAKEARSTLSTLLAKLGLEEDQLGAAQATAAAQLRHAAQRVEDVRKSMSSAQQASESAGAHIKTLLSEVRTAPDYAWLRDALTPQQQDDLAAEDLSTFAIVRDVVLSVTDHVFNAADELDSLTRLTHLLASPKPTKSEAAQLEAPMRDPLSFALGESLRADLNTESIRQRVFGGLTVEQLDLQSQVIVLAGDGRTEQRAMSAFSTGERAFAFTQARIKDLPPSPKPNRLLVLDEFGAFISADRMPDLRDFLETLDDLADQIVIILPLQVDYRAEMNDTKGDLHKRYAEKVRQLDARQYSAVPL
ncbi:hypothetical protein [Microbacterium sp. GCS4]|uniref:hypothetical protein n=1 Tax=Microbacterium sp. GCS4 TaxID=1692239 RepID=UPI00068017A7|nr:hypothetical protein [Microbacterium sp. GCS4]KNY07887.1 hypothetical protein AKH00_06620 [Microbacterium sp. GCS4]